MITFQRRLVSFAILALALVLGAGPSAAHGYKQKALEIIHPWCFATKDKSEPVEIYLVIKNTGKRADRLIAAATEGRNIELRNPAGAVVKSLPLPPGTETVLKRGAQHLVLIGQNEPLIAPDSFLATLTFERAGKIEVEVMVEKAPNAPSH